MRGKTLAELVDEFISYKQQSGYPAYGGRYYLNTYLSYVSRHFPDECIPGKASVTGCLSEHTGTPGYLYNLASVLREFSRFLAAVGYDAYIVPHRHIRQPVPAPPYLFREQEITAFFHACDSIREDRNQKGRCLVFPALFRLLYCCGLRCREVRMLRCRDVRLDRRYIDIIQSKGPKSRRIFLSEELAGYLMEFDARIGEIFPCRTYFFPNRKDAPYGAAAIEVNFKKFWYQAFPEKKGDGVRIRPYDFRHHFAYANMNRWLRQGKDVNAMLPYLMRYMGHSDVKSTLYYYDKKRIMESKLAATLEFPGIAASKSLHNYLPSLPSHSMRS